METVSQLDRKIMNIRSALHRHRSMMMRKAAIRADVFREERAVAELADRLEQLEARARIEKS